MVRLEIFVELIVFFVELDLVDYVFDYLLVFLNDLRADYFFDLLVVQFV